MASIKKSIRQNQALQVIQHSNNGMSIVKACKEVGIPRSTFYGFCKRHPDAIATFQEMQLFAGMQQLGLILDTQYEILSNIIQDGLSETTTPRQRLAIYKYIVKRTDELVESLHLNRRNDSDIDEILSGPKLIPAESRFSASEKEILIGGDTISAAYTTGS